MSKLLQMQPAHAGLRELEVAARAELNVRVGRRLTEAEWAGASSRLLEFVAILCAWENRRQQDRPAAGNAGTGPLPKAA